MIETPLERAARALCRAQGLPEDYTGQGTCGDPSWKFKVEQARAVIMAIREPSEAMLAATRKFAQASEAHAYTDMRAKSEWRAMIDATLAETP